MTTAHDGVEDFGVGSGVRGEIWMHGSNRSLFAAFDLSPRRHAQSVTVSAANGSPVAGHGYRMRSLLRQPSASEVFSAGGLVEKALQNDSVGLHVLMRKLSARLSRERWTEPLETGLDPADNPLIHSGYTYLLQLIAHDMARSSVSLAGSATGATGLANTRLFPLTLETIYGGGPDVTPAPYEFDRAYRSNIGAIPRTRFRTGQIRNMDFSSESLKPNGTVEKCPFRDIARAIPAQVRDGGLELSEQLDLSKAGGAPWRTEALLADSRNDDHALISQMAGLWQALHNQVIDLIPEGGALAAFSTVEQAYRKFFCARFVVTLIYRNIVLKDVLPLILHPAVFKLYTGAHPPRLDAQYPGPQDGVPVEFLAGAFRFGHAMVRDRYRVNSDEAIASNFALRQSSLRAPGDLPLNSDWLIDWSRFFSISERVPNYSHRIGPVYAGSLTETLLFPALTAADAGGLPDRDFVTASYSGLWSVPALCSEMRARGLGNVLPDYADWKGKVRDWLVKPAPGGFDPDPFTPADVDILVNDPPLPFFVLLEAGQAIGSKTTTDAAGGESLHLGALGSIIVAETIFGMLARTPIAFEKAGPRLQDQIADAARSLLGDATILSAIPEATTMSDLLHFMISGGAIPAPVPGP